MPSAPPRWAVPALAVAVAVLLVAGVAGAVVHEDETRGDDGAAGPAPTPTVAESTTSLPGAAPAPTVPPTAPPSAIAALVPELQTFVSRERGLPFKAPVAVELLDDGAFRQRLLEAEEEDEEELAEIQRVLRALDLIDADVDLRQAIRRLLGEAVVGFYDPETKELVVRGASPTPYVRSVLVHELTHALQDQHFQLHRPDLDEADDERALGFAGVVEGDAVRIENAYVRSLPSSERRAVAREEARYGGGLRDVPGVLLAILGFPYVTGPELVALLLRNGGQARLDAAFGAPPTTSEHLLHPELFVRGHAAVPVAPPPAGGEVIDEGVFGELGLLLLFQEDLEPETAARAAAGWGGDWYVAWDEGDETCVRAEFVMDTSRDTSELRSALSTWAGEHDGATVGGTGEGTGPVTLTSCG